MDYVNEYLKAHPRSRQTPTAPRMRCADGTHLSVQASPSHYCLPRDYDGPYSLVEVWCITGPRGKIITPRWGGDKDEPHGFVPVAKVNAFIKRHGGLAKMTERLPAPLGEDIQFRPLKSDDVLGSDPVLQGLTWSPVEEGC